MELSTSKLLSILQSLPDPKEEQYRIYKVFFPREVGIQSSYLPDKIPGPDTINFLRKRNTDGSYEWVIDINLSY